MPTLAPIAARERIVVLDILRGIAILLIFLFNIPDMGNSFVSIMSNPHSLDWSAADKFTKWFLTLLFAGTQRGLLQFLFGAGAVILLEKTLRPDGPVAAVDLFFRRNLFLALFGLFDIYGLLWWGDILFSYAMAAFFVFPFRRLSARALLAFSLVCIGALSIQDGIGYQHALATQSAVSHALQAQAQQRQLTADDRRALATHAQQLTSSHPPPASLAEERNAHLGSFSAYSRWMIGFYTGPYTHTLRPWFPRMTTTLLSLLLGMALYKLGITQGQRSSAFYASLAVLGYLPGLSIRALDLHQTAGPLPGPHIGMVLGEPARLLVTLGHLALINLIYQTSRGRLLLSPFQAAGRVAFSLYLMQNFLGVWILFPGFALGLWGRYSWFGLTLIALAVMAAQLLLANLWLRWFAIGPLEWLWRSLTYKQLQPFRHRRAVPDPVLV